MGRIDKGTKCTVVGCSDPAVRSISSEKVGRAGLEVSASRRAYLCKKHYRELKKKLRKETQLERWRMMAQR